MRVLRWFVAGYLAGSLALFSGCDSAPGPTPPGGHPPTISNFSYSPQEVIFDALPPEQVDGDQVRVPLEINVVARDGDGSVDEVAFVVQSPTNPTQPIATGTLTPAGDDRYTAAEMLTLSAVEIVDYPLLVYAVDDDGQLSGMARGQISFTRTFTPGEPPVIEEVVAPDTVQVPATDAVTFPIVAVVDDPDGLGDILQVEFWVESNPDNRFLMCDDGGGQPCGASPDSGDETAGDGRYTLTVQLPAGTTAGTRTFVFQATDRAGLTSELVEKPITVTN